MSKPPAVGDIMLHDVGQYWLLIDVDCITGECRGFLLACKPSKYTLPSGIAAPLNVFDFPKEWTYL